MADNTDFSVNNYTLEELLEILGITEATDRRRIAEHANALIQQYRNKPRHVRFLSAAANKVLTNYDQVESFFSGGSAEASDEDEEEEDGDEDTIIPVREGFVGGREPAPTSPSNNTKYNINLTGPKEYVSPAVNMWKNNQYASQETRNKLNRYVMPDRKHNIKVPMSLDHAVQLPKKLLMPNIYAQVSYAQGGMNPTLTNTYLTWLNVDSQFRDLTDSSRSSTSCTFNANTKPTGVVHQQGSPTDFIFTLTPPITDVISMTVGSLEVPLNGYYVYSTVIGNTTFDLSFNWQAPGHHHHAIRDLQDYVALRKETLAPTSDCKGGLAGGAPGPPPPTPPGIVAGGNVHSWDRLYFDVYMPLGNMGYWSPTTDISGTTIEQQPGRYICGSIPDGNYQNTDPTKDILMSTYMTLAMMEIVGPIPTANSDVAKSWLTYVSLNSEDSPLSTLSNISTPLFLRMFLSKGSMRPSIAANGSFDWWINGMLPICVPTSTQRFKSDEEYPQGDGKLPFMDTTEPHSTEAIFGNFIYCWNEIVCNWAHTDIEKSFQKPGTGGLSPLPPVYVPAPTVIKPPPLTFEEFLKLMPGYEDLQLNGGWGYNSCAGPPLRSGFSTLVAASGAVGQTSATFVDGTYNNIYLSTTSSGAPCPGALPHGYGAIVDVVVFGTTISSVVVVDGGAAYRTGDVLILPAQALGPASSSVTFPLVSTDIAMTPQVRHAQHFDRRTLQGYWHNKQGTTICAAGAPCWIPPAPEPAECGPDAQPSPPIYEWYPGTTYSALVPVAPTVSPAHAIWDPTAAIGSTAKLSPQPPYIDTKYGQCVPPYQMNQVQAYVLYYIQLFLIPEASKIYSKWWHEAHYPLITPEDVTASMTTQTETWLWLGGWCNSPLTDAGKPAYPESLLTGVGVAPWPFPFTYNWKYYDVLGAHVGLPTPLPPAPQLSEKAVSPGFSPTIPEFDLRWYDPSDPKGGMCHSTTCGATGGDNFDIGVTGTGGTKGRRRVNSNFGWSLGFKQSKSKSNIENVFNTSGQPNGGTFPDGFLSFAMLQPGAMVKDSSGNYTGMIGAPPWKPYILNSCLTRLEIENLEKLRIVTWEYYKAIGSFMWSMNRTALLNYQCVLAGAAWSWPGPENKIIPLVTDYGGVLELTRLPPSDPRSPSAEILINGWKTVAGARQCNNISQLWNLTPLNDAAVSEGGGAAVCTALWLGAQADCIINLGGTNYLTLVVDDFQHNRYGGNMPGMPGPASLDSFKLPAYYMRYQVSHPICKDASGNLKATVGPSGPNRVARACRQGTNAPPGSAGATIIDGSSNLTNAQKFTAAQIENHQQQKGLDEVTAPLITNVLLRAPMDRQQMAEGGLLVINPRYATASGGRGIGRRYYGPTRIKRLRIQLLDDHGKPMPLSCGNISLGLILERIYQY